jgi:hypothetical protein
MFPVIAIIFISAGAGGAFLYIVLELESMYIRNYSAEYNKVRSDYIKKYSGDNLTPISDPICPTTSFKDPPFRGLIGEVAALREEQKRLADNFLALNREPWQRGKPPNADPDLNPRSSKRVNAHRSSSR